MTKNRINIRFAGSAIAVVLALVAAPSLAQDTAVPAQPGIVVATMAPATPVVAPEAQPTIPEAAPSTTAVATTAPQIDAVPQPSSVTGNPFAPAASPTATTERTIRRVVAPQQRTSIVDPELEQVAKSADVAVLDNVDSQEGAAVLATAERAAARPVTTGLERDEPNATLTIAGGALAFGFGIAGLFIAGVARRRRRAVAEAQQVLHEIAPAARRRDDGFVTTPVRPAERATRRQGDGFVTTPVRTVDPATRHQDDRLVTPPERSAAIPGFTISVSNPAPSYASKFRNIPYRNGLPVADRSGPVDRVRPKYAST